MPLYGFSEKWGKSKQIMLDELYLNLGFKNYRHQRSDELTDIILDLASTFYT